ncbi:hypothetical protein PICSAR162_04312 [Mycobacterium avium subsp. paratuberculosis]|nr:hypothetical protein PICSAR162_04312 [Mycobacterium avium subsp. paratuberculosis]
MSDAARAGRGAGCCGSGAGSGARSGAGLGAGLASHQGVASSRRCRRGCGSAGGAGTAATSAMPLDPGLRRGSRVTGGVDASPALRVPRAAGCWVPSCRPPSSAGAAMALASLALGDETARMCRGPDGSATTRPASTVGGRYTSAVVPEPDSLAAGPRNPTRIPCQAAIRPTTKRPRCRAFSGCGSGFASPPACSRMLAMRRSASFIPRPESAMRTTTPPSPPRDADTRAEVVGGEYRSALSISSANRWMAPPAAAPSSEHSGSPAISTRR